VLAFTATGERRSVRDVSGSSFEVLDLISFEINSVAFSEDTGSSKRAVEVAVARMDCMAMSVAAVVNSAGFVLAMVARMRAVVVLVGDSSSLVRGARSFRGPGSVLLAMTFKSSVSLVFIGDLSASLDLIKAFKVDVLQVGHSYVLHVSMVKAAAFTPQVTSLLNDLLFIVDFRGRDDDNGYGRSRGIHDIGHFHRLSEIDLLLIAAPSAKSNQGDQDEAEENGHAKDEHPQPPPGPGHFMWLEGLGRKHATDETDTLPNDSFNLASGGYTDLLVFEKRNLRAQVPNAEVL